MRFSVTLMAVDGDVPLRRVDAMMKSHFVRPTLKYDKTYRAIFPRVLVAFHGTDLSKQSLACLLLLLHTLYGKRHVFRRSSSIVLPPVC